MPAARPEQLELIDHVVTRARTPSEFLALWLEHDLLPDELQTVLTDYYGSYRRSFTPWMRERFDEVSRDMMKILVQQPNARVLEVGSGCGTESLWMALNGARVHGVDVRSERVRVARARQVLIEQALGMKLSCRFEVGSVLELEDGRFDAIWMEHAFHHLEPRDQIVQQLGKLLAPGGSMVIAEVNALNPLMQAEYFLHRGFRTIGTYVDHQGREHPYGRERILSAHRLRKLLGQHGIRHRYTRYFRVFPNRPAFRRVRWIERVLADRRAMAPLLTNYTYVGERAA